MWEGYVCKRVNKADRSKPALTEEYHISQKQSWKKYNRTFRRI